MKATNQNFEGKLRKRLKPNIQYAKGFSFDEGSETSSALSKCTRTDAARKKKVAVKFEANLSSPTYGLKALKAPDLKVSWSSCYDIKNEDTFCDFKDAFLDENTGEIYEGGWKFGMKHGPGICLYNDGLLYDGNWNNGKECGKGTLMTGDRKLIYCGDWVEGIIQGYGTYHYVNGDIYVGDWRDGRRHGRGDYVFCNGCRYSGDWKDDKRCGKGLFFWSDDSYYDGEWESDLRQGRGVLDLWNGFRYDGMWWMNNFEGKGVCTFPGGQIYQVLLL